MSTDLPDDVADRVERVRVEDEMEQSYIDYAMSVIAGRALPDVRDGLKPVHRRILYAMHQDGITSGSGHRKSSSIVGTTMGDYHPHGDQAIYDTLVRLGQDFSMRNPLIDGQGNFGSVDGDPAAAMRYTEARMAPIAEELLADIEKGTVNFESNYDDRLEEPDVLPAAFPNLLVNGSSGIAVGMSTNIPPHNLGEIIDATVHLIDQPDCSIEALMDYVKGPDFPTAANIVGRNGIHEAYKTGRGRIRVRADFEIQEDENRIIITELPYQQNKARMVERIAEDVNEGTIEGIRDLRDESDRDGIRVVIDLKRGALPEVVKNQLLERHLERTFGVINLALVNGAPQVLDLKETLAEYIKHRKEVVRRRSEHDLTEATDREHILEGRLLALQNVDDVVETIRSVEDRAAAKEALSERFGFSADQAAHIVRMQLGSLTSLETQEIEAEYETVQAEIERLETILESEQELLSVIKDELKAVKDEYADERKTSIIEDTGTVTREDLIPEEQVVVVISEEDYIKRMPAAQFRAQNRGGKGIIGADLKESDSVSSVFVTNTHDFLLCFTDQGQVYQLKAYQIPEMSRTARGKSAVNVLDLDDDEEIEAVVNTDDIEPEEYLTMVTRGGYIKRTACKKFENILSTGIRAISLEEGDALADVEVTDGAADVVIATASGMSIRFDESEARAMGRTARGVRGIELQDGDRVAGIAATVEGREEWLLTVTKNGYGKRTDIGDYRVQSRNGKGLIDIKTNERNGTVSAINGVSDGDNLILMSEDGKILRTRVSDISLVGRNTMGVRVMDLDAGDRVATVDVLEDTPGGDTGTAADDEAQSNADRDADTGADSNLESEGNSMDAVVEEAGSPDTAEDTAAD